MTSHWEPGKCAEDLLYEEDRVIMLVRLLRDESNALYERCTLQVVSILSAPEGVQPLRTGVVFAFSRKRDVFFSGVGRLYR
jgi:hypothetical protein